MLTAPGHNTSRKAGGTEIGLSVLPPPHFPADEEQGMSIILAEVAAWRCSCLHPWRPPEGLLLAHQPQQASSPSAFTATSPLQCPQSLSQTGWTGLTPVLLSLGCPPASPLCPVPWSSRPQLDGAIPGQLRMSGSGARKVCARWTGQSSSSWHTFLLFICCRENGVGPVRAFYNPGKAGRVKI